MHAAPSSLASIFVLATMLAFSSPLLAQGPTPPNLLLIIPDDLGIDSVLGLLRVFFD